MLYLLRGEACGAWIEPVRIGMLRPYLFWLAPKGGLPRPTCRPSVSYNPFTVKPWKHALSKDATCMLKTAGSKAQALKNTAGVFHEE